MSDRLIIRTTGSTGPSGGAGSTALDDLTDVTITTAASGQVLKYNGTAWVNDTDATGGGGGALDDLTDVTITAAASGDILRHNGTAWVDTPGTTHFEVAGAAAAAQAASQPLDSDLTAIAALTTTAYGRAFLTLANQAATMALLSAASDTASGIVELATSAETITGTDTTRAITPAGGAAAYQPLDSDLTAIAALTTTSYGRAFLALVNAAAGRTALDVPSNAEAILDTLIDAKGDIITATAADTPARLAVGTNGHVLTADSAEATGLKWAASAGGTASNRIFQPTDGTLKYMRPPGGHIQNDIGTLAMNGNWTYYSPMVIPHTCTISAVLCFVATAVGGSNASISIHACDYTGVPSGLTLDCGTVSTATTGLKSITGLSTSLSAGYYLIRFNPSGGITVNASLGSSWQSDTLTTSGMLRALVNTASTYSATAPNPGPTPNDKILTSGNGFAYIVLPQFSAVS